MLQQLKTLGYVPLANPCLKLKPLDLLLQGKDGAERLNASIKDVFFSQSVSIPSVSQTRVVGDSFNANCLVETNGRAKAGIISTFGGILSKSRFGLNLESDSSVAIEIRKPLEHAVNLVKLDRYINSASVIDGLSFIQKSLLGDQIFIVTSVIATNKFSFKIGNKNLKNAEATSSLDSIVELGIEASRSYDGGELIEYDGEEMLIIGIKACKIHYSGNFSRKGIFTIQLGKISTVKNEQLPVTYLKDIVTTNEEYGQRCI